jgi:exopolysaccharide biosynthesis polyprenyl glycosylphosphotransferase
MIDLAGLTLWFCLTRGAAIGLLRRAGYKIRLLVLGPQGECEELVGELRRHGPLVLEVQTLPETASGKERIGEARRALHDLHIDEVLLAETRLPQRELSELLAACERQRADVYLFPDLDLSILASSRVVSIAGLPLVPLQPPILTGVYAPVKRLIDVIVTVVLMVLLSPVALAAAIAIRMESGGPALYSQERAGQGRKAIRVRKFRTMIADAEAKSGPVLSDARDPRVTRVGRILRKYRIDELPQLWNVLKGDMSLVGPRPERPEFIAKFVAENPLYERRFLVKPGLTGLAQIHGRYDSDYAHKLRYDLIYINSMSFVTDLRIMIATLRTVLTGHGAVV